MSTGVHDTQQRLLMELTVRRTDWRAGRGLPRVLCTVCQSSSRSELQYAERTKAAAALPVAVTEAIRNRSR